jgi:hypothetical protein
LLSRLGSLQASLYPRGLPLGFFRGVSRLEGVKFSVV